MSSYLMHHGILGQKWGIRRYQNKDGSLTEAGRKHYGYAAEQLSKKAKSARLNAEDFKQANEDLKKKYLNNKNGFKNWQRDIYDDDEFAELNEEDDLKTWKKSIQEDMDYNDQMYKSYISDAEKIESQMKRYMNATHMNDLSQKEIDDAEKLVKQFMKDQKHIKNK